jgi:hypothetical protein
MTHLVAHSAVNSCPAVRCEAGVRLSLSVLKALSKLGWPRARGAKSEQIARIGEISGHLKIENPQGAMARVQRHVSRPRLPAGDGPDDAYVQSGDKVHVSVDC